MSEAKAEILRRIREATADGPVADPVQRTYRRTSSGTGPRWWRCCAIG